MRAAREVQALLCDGNGAVGARLHVAVLPRKSKQSTDMLWYAGDSSESSVGASSIEVLEGHEYRYQWLGIAALIDRVVADPEEIFHPDTSDGRSGRLRPGLATGTVQVTLRSDSDMLGCAFQRSWPAVSV